MRPLYAIICALALSTGCNSSNGDDPVAGNRGPTGPGAAAKLAIRADGDTEIKPDLAQLTPELQKVYSFIDDHIDEHVENLQKWIRQPSISNSASLTQRIVPSGPTRWRPIAAVSRKTAS